MICEWKIGDVFAYRMESDNAKERGLYGKYLLFQKVDEGPWYPNHIIPIVYVRITRDDKLPNNIDEFENSEYVQTSVVRYEHRFWPYNFSRLEEDIAEKSKIKYEVDEFGFLPVYRLEIIKTAKRLIPKKLIYVGNFQNVVPPSKEFVPHSKTNIGAVKWKYLEEVVSNCYFNYNLRQLPIYQQDS